MSVKHIAIVVALVFAVTLAVVVGKQMSTEAMAVVIGIVCGVAAGIPTSFLLFVVLTRREASRTERDLDQPRPPRQPAYPPVVVIQGGTPQQAPPMLPGGYWPSPQTPPMSGRQFHMVGGDELLLDDDR